MSAQPPESGIPVLTQVLQAPVYGVDLPERRLASSQAMPQANATDSALSDACREQIMQGVRDGVLHDLLRQVDLLLEGHIRDSLADVLQTAVDGLTRELRQGLEQALAHVVTEAVTAELNNYLSLKK